MPEMRIARLSAGLILALVSFCSQAQPPEQQIALTGKLIRIIAIGEESTGWALELDSPTTIDNKEVRSIQVSYRKTSKLEELANKHVKVTGELAHRHGVETDERPVLKIFLIKEVSKVDGGHNQA